MVCSNCGVKVDNKDKYCFNCGTEIIKPYKSHKSKSTPIIIAVIFIILVLLVSGTIAIIIFNTQTVQKRLIGKDITSSEDFELMIAYDTDYEGSITTGIKWCSVEGDRYYIEFFPNDEKDSNGYGFYNGRKFSYDIGDNSQITLTYEDSGKSSIYKYKKGNEKGGENDTWWVEKGVLFLGNREFSCNSLKYPTIKEKLQGSIEYNDSNSYKSFNVFDDTYTGRIWESFSSDSNQKNYVVFFENRELGAFLNDKNASYDEAKIFSWKVLENNTLEITFNDTGQTFQYTYSENSELESGEWSISEETLRIGKEMYFYH